MPLSDFFPQMKDWQSVPAQSSQTQKPGIPDPQTQSTPYLRAPLPLPLQYSPDSLRQYNRPGMSSFRVPPIPASGQPVVNSAASSVTQTTVIETVQVSAAGPSGAIQFNSGGVLDGVSQLEWNNVSSVLSIVGSLSVTGNFTLVGTLTAAVFNATTGFQVGGLAPAGEYLRGNGTDFVASAILAGDVPTLNQNTTGTAANLSGTPALPNGTTATTQTFGDNTTKLATDAFVQAAVSAVASANFPYGGDGSDGTVTFDGTSTILGLVPVSSTYTLIRDIFLINGTVNLGVTIITNGFAIFATGTFTNHGTLENNGGLGSNGATAVSSSGGTGGNQGANGGLATAHYARLVSENGGSGGNGATGNGTQGTASATPSSVNAPAPGGSTGANGASGGAGGNGGTGTGGASRAGTVANAPVSTVQIARTAIRAELGEGFPSNSVTLGNYTIYSTPNGGGSGGSGGGGDGTNAGGGGGGGGGNGGSGGSIGIFAATLVNSGTIEATGANGGNGGNGFTPVAGNAGGGGGGGAGGGGNGGTIWLVYTSFTNTGTISVAGGSTPGTPGSGGSGVGSGLAGSSGGTASAGQVGVVFEIQV